MAEEHVGSDASVRGIWLIVGVVFASMFAATATLLFCQAFLAK